MSDAPAPLFVSSVFKSGTWLLRAILEQATGLRAYEPENIPAEPDYGDASLIRFPSGTFFSWHSRINEDVEAAIREHGATPVFLVRNIYDLAVSMYHHLADDIDADVGRAAGQTAYFRDMTRDMGLALVIAGYNGPRGTFEGLGPHLAHIEQMLAYATEHPALVASFERLTLAKDRQVRALLDYLGVAVDDAALAALIQATGFEAMKGDAAAAGSGSHFRLGKPGGHAELIRDHHLHMINHQVHAHAPRLPELVRRTGFHEVLMRAG